LSWNLSLKEEGLKEEEFKGRGVRKKREFKGGGSLKEEGV
jgi:hypothetical protein